MLELREYTRKELLQIYSTTTRLDAIKKKISRQGYSYTETGRGSSYKMLITALPSSGKWFSQYCVNELNFSPQTDFNILKGFFYRLLTDDNFVSLQYNEMVEVLKRDGIDTTAITISKYYHTLMEANIIAINNEFVYYVFDCNTKRNHYITETEYKAMYKTYWHTIYSENNLQKAEAQLLFRYGNKPKKRKKYVMNGIFKQHYDTIISLIEQEH